MSQIRDAVTRVTESVTERPAVRTPVHKPRNNGHRAVNRLPRDVKLPPHQQGAIDAEKAAKLKPSVLCPIRDADYGTATRIRRARKEAGLRQADLATECGYLSAGAVGNWEKGGCRDTAILTRIAEVCLVSEAWLAFGEPYPRERGGLPASKEAEKGIDVRRNECQTDDKLEASCFPLFTGTGTL